MPTAKFENLPEPPADWRGRAARDLVSKFTGFITARYDYINGCVRLEISGTDKDGKPEGFVFDQQQVEYGSTWLDGFAPASQTTSAPKKAVGGPPQRRPIAR